MATLRVAPIETKSRQGKFFIFLFFTLTAKRGGNKCRVRLCESWTCVQPFGLCIACSGGGWTFAASYWPKCQVSIPEPRFLVSPSRQHRVDYHGVVTRILRVASGKKYHLRVSKCLALVMAPVWSRFGTPNSNYLPTARCLCKV